MIRAGHAIPLRIAIAFVAAMGMACRDDTTNRVADPNKPPTLVRPAEGPPSTVVTSPSSVRRLTKGEYINSISDVLGFDATAQAAQLAIDTAPDGLRNDVKSQLHSEAGTEGYARAAEQIAAQVDWKSSLLRHVTCTEKTPECASAFVKRLGRLLLQRPLSDEAAAVYSHLFEIAAAEGLTFEDGSRLVLRAMLQAPEFIFVTGPMHASGRVDSHTLASRLTLLLWKAIPDANIAQAVDEGALTDGQSVEQTVARMLRDPRARRGLRAFIEDWLKLHTLDLRTPPTGMGLSPRLYFDMKTETLALFERLAFVENKPILSMFVDRQTELPASVAPLYGYESNSAHSTMVDLTSDPNRLGVLTQPAFLSLSAEGENTSIVRRGLTILRTFLCSDIPAPPANAAVLFALLPDTLSERERFAQHSIDPACRNCHQTFDPLGLAFESYDGLGRHHFVDEHGNPLRQDGMVTLDGVEQEFRTVAGFATILGQSETVERCVVSRLLGYAMGREITEGDQGMLDGLSRSFLNLPRADRTWMTLLSLVANHPALQHGEATP
jgi:Protein of unknown function (DUF1588)/Protein of unknown function (DUF1592)/Protein of unknown function (DUF1595)/Protein of unknown function (DUF1587)/Protein of unknown function (DUF1585)